MSISRLFIKKSVARIQQEAMQSTLKRSLGPWNLLSLGIGCIIGAGIFVMTGEAAANHAGPAIILSFVLAGFACAFAGLCYAELSSILPISGSAYTYAYATLGEAVAWIMGWLLVLEYGLAASAVAVGWSGYVSSFMMGFDIIIPPQFTSAYGTLIEAKDVYADIYTNAGYTIFSDENGKNFLMSGGELVRGIINLPAMAIVLIATTLLSIGISESAKINNIIVFVKLSVILMFICIGVFYINVDNWTPFVPENTGKVGQFGWSGIERAASIIFFAYVGFEAVSTAAQEARNPQKDMPFGIIGSLVVCTLLYMGVAAVLTGVVHYSQLGVKDPLALAADSIGLGWFAWLIKIGAITGLSSVTLVLLYGQTRIFYIMSRDGLLPGCFSKVSEKTQTPIINTVFVGSIVAVAAGLTPLSALGDMVSLGTLCAFMIVCISVLYLRHHQPDLHRPFRTPYVPLVPILGILACGYLIYGMFTAEKEHSIGLPLIVFMAVGVAVYFLYGIRHSKARHGESPLAGNVAFVKDDHEHGVE